MKFNVKLYETRRKALVLSHSEIGRRAGIPSGYITIRRWLRGDSLPTEKHLAAVAAVLGVGARELVK
jgi:transcriptional regulator with XRE-family HTH domain